VRVSRAASRVRVGSCHQMLFVCPCLAATSQRIDSTRTYSFVYCNPLGKRSWLKWQCSCTSLPRHPCSEALSLSALILFDLFYVTLSIFHSALEVLGLKLAPCRRGDSQLFRTQASRDSQYQSSPSQQSARSLKSPPQPVFVRACNPINILLLEQRV
jgi:hypothetical protein